MKTESIIKYTCDWCGREEYVLAKDPAPMRKFVLPMKAYDETGHAYSTMHDEKVDLCTACMRILSEVLETYYDIHYMSYAGLTFRPKPTVEGKGSVHGEWREANNRLKSGQFICSTCGGLVYYPQANSSRETRKICPYELCPHCGSINGRRIFHETKNLS